MSENTSNHYLFNRPRLVIAYILMALISLLFVVLSIKNLVEVIDIMNNYDQRLNAIDESMKELGFNSNYHVPLSKRWLYYYSALLVLSLSNLLFLGIGWKRKSSILMILGLIVFFIGVGVVAIWH